jgi:predicted GTPase
MAEPRRVIILGAAGRDFHNFNVLYRDNPAYRVVAFTATQIPGIEGRKYPASLAGTLYPDGIPIYPEEDLPDLIRKHGIQSCVFSYSDVDYAYIGHRIALATAHGADFVLLGAWGTMLKARVPLIAICAVRTGSGKSQTTRRVAGILRAHEKKVVVVRHPMPYGDIASQAVQRFATYEDLARHETTIEEREEFEPHIDKGTVVYAGVDYEKILHQAEREAEVLLWDGGNNDTPFFQPDLHIVVADPLRAGHELSYYPGETNLRMADVVILNKVDTATPESVEAVKANVRSVNPDAVIVEAASPITADEAESNLIRGKRVLAIEDGPTLTHGGMEFGAAYLAAQRFGASEIVSAAGHAVGSIKETYRKYPNSRKVLPAMGYGPKQIKELEETIETTPCDVVVSGTPIDLSRVLKTRKPVVHVRYELDEIGHPNLEDVLRDWEFI